MTSHPEEEWQAYETVAKTCTLCELPIPFLYTEIR